MPHCQDTCDLAGDTDLPRATTTVLGTLALWNGFSLDHVHVDLAQASNFGGLRVKTAGNYEDYAAVFITMIVHSVIQSYNPFGCFQDAVSASFQRKSHCRPEWKKLSNETKMISKVKLLMPPKM